METTCQASYPLNSENESPPGTFRVYLSCAEMAQPPTQASSPAILRIVSILLPFIGSTSFFNLPQFLVRIRGIDQEHVCYLWLTSVAPSMEMPFHAICMPMHIRMKAITRKIPCTVEGDTALISLGA